MDEAYGDQKNHEEGILFYIRTYARSKKCSLHVRELAAGHKIGTCRLTSQYCIYLYINFH